MNLSLYQQRRLQQQATELLGQTAPWLGPLERRVLTALLVRTAQGWHLFVRRAPRSADTPVADAFLIGAGGVITVVIDERLPDERTARAIARHAEERCAGMRGPRGQVLAASALHHVVVLPGGSGRISSPSGLFRVLTEPTLDALFRRDTPLLDRRQVESIANQAAVRLTEYRRPSLHPSGRAPDDAGLLDPAELTADQLDAAQQRPFETWMTFLHPHQQAVATRDYGGPARISGPAGTGKTVVALHRLRHLARHSVGPLLFTTFVRTLPAVHQASFRRLAPELADRVQFVNLHAWVRGFLADRGQPVTVHRSQVDNAFARAWLACRAQLEDLEPTPAYWRTEIDRVIKGRDLTTLREYVTVSRRGRSVRLDAGQRERVWQFYEAYQRNLADRRLHDYNDVISVALAELVARPLEQRYAAVVVDEVQDITLTGLRLLRQLSGDGPNRLLLVGDGQQQVYPGGWRLSDAGIPVQGRGEVLRVNYRNRATVLGFAQRFDATNHVDDLDGAAGVALRDVESANSGGEIQCWQGQDADLPDAIVAAIAALPAPRSRTALIVFDRRGVDRCTAILHEAGIPLLPLDQYTGEPDDMVKVGTVHRAKGLDFQAVLAVVFPQNGAASGATEQEARELRGRQHLVAATRARDYLWWAVVEPRPAPSGT
jgi:hypothetical protein